MRFNGLLGALWVVGIAGGCSDEAASGSADAAPVALDVVSAADLVADTPAETAADTWADALEPADTGGPDAPLPPCTPIAPEEATWGYGVAPDGTVVAVGGRSATPIGPSVSVPGFATDVAVHPTKPVVYVSSTGTADRRLLVVSRETEEVLQDIDRGEAFYGLEVSPDGARVYASGGDRHVIDAYDVADDGTLTEAGEVEVGSYPSGTAISPDGATLWVGAFAGRQLVEVDTATLTVTRTIEAKQRVWDVAYIPGRDEVYYSDLEGATVAVLDLVTGAVVDQLPVPVNPAGLAVRPDGGRVWVAVAGSDAVAAIDTASREVISVTRIAEDDLVTPAGEPLPRSNVNALWYDADSGRLFVSRGADNAVSVLHAQTMERLGAIPAAAYPSDVEVTADGAFLVVAEGKGGGSGPNDGTSAKKVRRGSVTFVELAGLDLTETTSQVIANFSRPQLVFPTPECQANYPIPTGPEGGPSPIEHVVLIVKENKTFDCIFGDVTDMDIDVDPDLVRWGSDITPNTHALARQFTLSDSFFSEAPNSDTGHIFLTAGHLTEYVERIWLEKTRTGRFQGYQLGDQATPADGNWFTHLLRHGVSLRIFGQIVGMFQTTPDGQVPFDFSDQDWPGGPFYNTSVEDVRKAARVVEYVDSGELAQFTFVLLPNDHTEGTTPGSPTPESMVADNDLAVGMVVEALTKAPSWPKTAIIILQDDPQGCEDHVDAHRAPLIVVSPYARRGHVSHAHISFVSVFATMARVLGVPPMGRPDASASPMWDFFTSEVDLTPYTAIPRTFPPELNPPTAPGAKKSAKMTWRTPDRNPQLGLILDAYRLFKMGRISEQEAKRRIDDPSLISPEAWEELLEEAEEEAFAHDAALKQWELYKAQRAQP